jgi:hypothetical protein
LRLSKLDRTLDAAILRLTYIILKDRGIVGGMGFYPIDYRCDDEMKTLKLGRHLGIIA